MPQTERIACKALQAADAHSLAAPRRVVTLPMVRAALANAKRVSGTGRRVGVATLGWEGSLKRIFAGHRAPMSALAICRSSRVIADEKCVYRD